MPSIPTKTRTGCMPRAVYALRLGIIERRVLEAAAAHRGVTLGEYIRAAAGETARRELEASTP